MTSIDQRPADLELDFVAGDDFGIAITVLENGVAYVSTGATVVTAITQGGVASSTNFTTGWVSNVLSIALSDTQTAALTPGTYRYSVEVTKSSVTRTWIVGFISVLDQATSKGGTSVSTATLAISTSPTVDMALTIGVAGPPGGGGGGGAVDSVNGQTGTVVLDAGDIGFTPVGTIAATDVQTAVAEVATDYIAADAAHVAAGDPHAQYQLESGYTAADVLSKLLTVDGAGSGLDADLLDGNSSAFFATATGLSDHLADTIDAHDASAISFVAVGTIAATDAQTAIAEVATDAATALTTHESDTTSVHGITDTSTLYRSGGTDVAVADGGTGSSTASGARTNLGLVIGTDVSDVPTAKAETLLIAVGDETTALTTGTAKVTFRMPFAFTLTAVRASLTTASSSGLPTVDINEAGTTILSTKLTIDANELTSTTAATAAVISDSALADDAQMTIDIDVAGTGAAGLKVYMIGTRA